MTKDTNDIITGRDVAIKRQLRIEYQEWLETKSKNTSPHNAHLFAIEKINAFGSSDYMGKTEREIIQIIEG
jgi:hypothetical protein